MTLRPTIIGEGRKPGDAPAAASPPDVPLQPTVMTPTVIGVKPPAAVPAPVVPTSMKPTALPAGRATPASAPPPPAGAAPSPRATTIVDVPLAATRVRGEERKGIEVRLDDLRERNEKASAAALRIAAATLAGLVPATCTITTLEQIGRAEQEAVGRLVDRVLKVVDEEAPRTAARHVSRLLEILGELAEELTPSPLPWRRKSMHGLLVQHRAEIDLLRGHLERTEGQLVNLRSKLEGMEAESRLTMDALNGAAIAAAEARRVFTDARRTFVLDVRENDLAKSIALLEEQCIRIQRLTDDFTDLAQRIRDAALHALPAWLATATSLGHDTLHDTDRFSLLDQLHALLLTLKLSR